jgi:quinoprotein glucose dehydrogenase
MREPGFAGSFPTAKLNAAFPVRINPPFMTTPAMPRSGLLAAWLGAMTAAEAAPRFERTTWAEHESLGRAVAMAVDERGRVFVSQSGRSGGRGVFSVAGRRTRVEADAGIETVAQRTAMIRGWLEAGELNDELAAAGAPANRESFLRQFSESIILFEDRDGDGVAERRTGFAGAFNDEAAGPAGGLLAQDSTVSFACAPNLWLLDDPDKDDRANIRRILASGLGVRVGLPENSPGPITSGPDGRIYFAVGDRGFNVRGADSINFHGPTRGAVFRCWPDGAGLEWFAGGFRSPAALAFDHSGTLFVIDESLRCVPEGFEGGWEATLNDDLVALRNWAAQSRAWCLPPIGHVGDQVSDLLADPGFLLTGDPRGRFLAAKRDGLSEVRLEPAGAGYRIVKTEWLESIAPGSKISVTPLGRILVLSPAAKSISSVVEPAAANSPGAREVAGFFKAGFKHRAVEELVPLLGHPDARVRLGAQSALVAKGWQEVVPPLVKVAVSDSSSPARRHAIWAMGGLARENPLLLTPLISLFESPDETVRMIAARVLAGAGCINAGPPLVRLLGDSSPAVRAAAAVGVGRLAPEGALEALLELAADAFAQDPFLRHAVVVGLSRLGDPYALAAATREDRRTPVRLAAVLALRRLESPLCSKFLRDGDPQVSLEAARAIYDTSIESAWPELAAMLDGDHGPARPDAEFLRLALAASLRLGRPEDAARVAALAARAESDIPDDLRRMALDGLVSWDHPPEREPIWGRRSPCPPRAAGLARKAIAAHLPDMLKNSRGGAHATARRLESLLASSPATPAEIIAFIGNTNEPESMRLFYLRELAAQPSEGAHLESACRAALLDASAENLRTVARALLMRRNSAEAAALARAALEGSHVPGKQEAIRQLDALRTDEGEKLLLKLLRSAGGASADLSIVPELLEAAERRERADGPNGRDFREAVGHLRTALRSPIDTLRRWRAAGDGGDPMAGRLIYHSKIARCTECHAINGRGSGIGPDLAGIAARLSPAILLEAVVQPSARVASGHGFVTAIRNDGSVISGPLAESGRESITIRTAGVPTSLRRADIRELSNPESPCRPMGTLLTLRELRDLIAFLKSLK